MGGADFHIAMTDMLLAGFPVAGNTAQTFPALRADQVAFGAPGLHQRRQRLHRPGRRPTGGQLPGQGHELRRLHPARRDLPRLPRA